MFKNLPEENLQVETVLINQKSLDIDKKYYENYDIVLIESPTGTGKTKETATKCKIILKSNEQETEYDNDDKEHKIIISIVNLISLALEQIGTFEEQSKTTLKDYRKVKFAEKKENSMVICINSIHKMLEYKEDFFKNVVLYIDEINNLHQTMTHNSTLDKNLNSIYMVLIKMIKNCKKIIFTDAIINQNVLNLLSSRKTNNKTILIKNTHKKYKDIDAIQYFDKNEYYNELKTHIKEKKYFLFGCDVCKLVTSFYNDLINEFPEQKDDFILITSETNFHITEASKQFKNKYVFYSPSVVTGVNFLYKEKAQTQFLYLTGISVKPDNAFQMGSRTRNIKNLKYFVEEIKPNECKYNNLEQVEKEYKEMIKINDKVLRMSYNINADDDGEIVDNTFFKLFCYNEYIINIYDTGYNEHFNNLLKHNGFTLKTKGKKEDFKLETKRKLKDLKDETKEILIKQFGKSNCKNYNDGEISKSNIEVNEEIYEKRCEILGIKQTDTDGTTFLDYDDVKKYSMLIQDDYSLNNVLNYQKLLYTDKYIETKLKEKYTQCKSIKNISSCYNKISLLKTVENTFKFKRFNFNDENITFTEFDNDTQKLIDNVFRLKTNFNNKKEVIKSYEKMIKNICGDMNVIEISRKGKERKRTYKLNIDVFGSIVDLVKLKNPYFDNCNTDLIKEYYPEVEIKQNHKEYSFLDYGLDEEEDEKNKMYRFKKIK